MNFGKQPCRVSLSINNFKLQGSLIQIVHFTYIYMRLLWWLNDNLPANARDKGSIPGSGRSFGKGNGNPF